MFLLAHDLDIILTTKKAPNLINVFEIIKEIRTNSPASQGTRSGSSNFHLKSQSAFRESVGLQEFTVDSEDRDLRLTGFSAHL